MKKSQLRQLIREAIKSTANEGLFGPSPRQSRRDHKADYPKHRGSTSRDQDFGHPDNIVSVVDDMTLTMGEDAFIAAIFKALPLEDAKSVLRSIVKDNPIIHPSGTVDYEWLKENEYGRFQPDHYNSREDYYSDDPRMTALEDYAEQIEGMSTSEALSYLIDQGVSPDEAESLVAMLNTDVRDMFVNEGNSDPMSNLLQTFEKAMTDKATYDQVVAELEGAPDHVKPKLMQMADEVIPEKREGVLELISDLENGDIDPEDIGAQETREVLIQQFKEFVKITEFGIDMIRKHVNGSFNEMFMTRPPVDVEALQVTSENGTVVLITDPRDIEDFLAGNGTVYGEDADGAAVEVNINSAIDYQYV
jgi:hypothetical protein